MNAQVLNLKDERTLRRVDKAMERTGELWVAFREGRERTLEDCEEICENLEVLINSGLFNETELAAFNTSFKAYSDLGVELARAQGVPILLEDGTVELNGKIITVERV